MWWVCRNDRYDALRLCVGDHTLQRLADLKLFMVTFARSIYVLEREFVVKFIRVAHVHLWIHRACMSRWVQIRQIDRIKL